MACLTKVSTTRYKNHQKKSDFGQIFFFYLILIKEKRQRFAVLLLLRLSYDFFLLAITISTINAIGINTGIDNTINAHIAHTSICSITGANHTAIAVQLMFFIVYKVRDKHICVIALFIKKSSVFFVCLFIVFSRGSLWFIRYVISLEICFSSFSLYFK